MSIAIIRQSLVVALLTVWVSGAAPAQLTAPIGTSPDGIQVASLEQQLINRLKATTEDRQAYIRLVVLKTETGELETARVLGVERYAIRRNPNFPFPYFERAMRHEANKVGIYLPPVQLLAYPANRTAVLPTR
ncbi:MAG: hypothetical protein EHM77_07940 [Planctomycetaceae bacterium]|nr:MAG: hypothetical protein EHM77_07940 [Planctomycetaceae bacterium]